jgi:hypothetical protein
MASLPKEQRRELERTIIEARRVADAGARKALESLAVHHHEPWSSMTADQRNLRNRLREHGRQLSDRRDERRSTQTIDHLASECAYEHWHRMLFARFLAESNLLIEPDSGVPISLAECGQLANERGMDWLTLASDFAVRMLPRVFQKGDPVLEVALPPEARRELEKFLGMLSPEVFAAEDSLGWVYQFWQTDRKNKINDSGDKIGADEIAPVTQLFTEDYMVLFLLHNTLGAWWAAKRKAESRSHELRGYEWTYLRFRDDRTPAAGSFGQWPTVARDLRLLDPCMGSGHFLVFALPILVGFRMEEEGLSLSDAITAVLRDNLFGLEIDYRCTQIAAFNLALTAWKMAGRHFKLPSLNLACSGMGIQAKEEDWIKLAGKEPLLRETMKELYQLFRQGPILGSLIDPKRVAGHLFASSFEKTRPLLEKALGTEHEDVTENELAVTAKGLLGATHILCSEFNVVLTNVPYLSRMRHDGVLAQYAEDRYSLAKTNLATIFIERCISFLSKNGTAGLVTPQNWNFQDRYQTFREYQLKNRKFYFVVQLGPNAFETISGEEVKPALICLGSRHDTSDDSFFAMNLTDLAAPSSKASGLVSTALSFLKQIDQLKNPNYRLLLSTPVAFPRLETYAAYHNGVQSGDSLRFVRRFWELPRVNERWTFQQTTAPRSIRFGGMTNVFLWDGGHGEFVDFVCQRLGTDNPGAWIRGKEAWGRKGVIISATGVLKASFYLGTLFDDNTVVLLPAKESDIPALWLFCSSDSYNEEVRKLDHKLMVRGALVKVPIDIDRWRRLATQDPTGCSTNPHSNDPTQFIFSGHPNGAHQALHVAVARLLGYRWSRQSGSSFPDCPALRPDGLEMHADADGIVCLNPAKGEQPAAARLRSLLAEAYGGQWSNAKQAELLAEVGFGGKILEEWLRDGFFEQHSELFHQRPFIWHVWDGLKDGFHALVNYHKLVEPNGVGRRIFEKLIYTYLGDWIERQRADQKAGAEGADARVAAATHLKAQLESILEGEAPFDIFVRWKSLHDQPIGWEPDINDGVRVNIRPFMAARVLSGRGKNPCILRVEPKIKWDKDRGKEPHQAKEDFPWFWSCEGSSLDFAGGKEFDGNRWNDLHYARKSKLAARERQASAKEGPKR